MSNEERVGVLTREATRVKGHTSSVDSWNGRGHLPEVIREPHEPHAAAPVTTTTMNAAEPLGGGGAAELWHRGLDWPVVIWIGLVHVLALVAPFYFSWQGVIACAIL